ncbi:hypothetical protein BDV12DRAFT_198354 [Aspergillus spectabilis]
MVLFSPVSSAPAAKLREQTTQFFAIALPGLAIRGVEGFEFLIAPVTSWNSWFWEDEPVSTVVDAFLKEHTLNPLSAPIAYYCCVDNRFDRVHEQIVLEYKRREAEAILDGFEVPRLVSLIVIVDGENEIIETRRHEILKALTRLLDESASVVKIFLSSRDNIYVFAGIPDAAMLRVQDTNTRRDMDQIASQSRSLPGPCSIAPNRTALEQSW